MPDSADQNLANHMKFVPLYHFVGTPLVVAAFFWALTRAIMLRSSESLLVLVLATATVVQQVLLRQFPLKVQDRLIRLEEQLRLQRLLPEPLRARIGEFSANQLIGMRFASDAELPQLAQAVLDKPLTTRKAIKEEIKTWRPDTFRV